MEREACVCDHGFERSDLCAEIIIILIIISTSSWLFDIFAVTVTMVSRYHGYFNICVVTFWMETG